MRRKDPAGADGYAARASGEDYCGNRRNAHLDSVHGSTRFSSNSNRRSRRGSKGHSSIDAPNAKHARASVAVNELCEHLRRRRIAVGRLRDLHAEPRLVAAWMAGAE